MTIKKGIITTAFAVSLFCKEHYSDVGHSPIVTISGGFDPLHIGHLQYIETAVMLKGTNGLFIVIVNGDGFLKRKNGYVFMSLEERMMMLSSQQGVDYVVPWDDGTQTVSGALELIKPNIFAKGGGDVSREDIPELKTCEKINCALITGIGGTVKIQSSTNLVTKFTNDKIQTNI